MDVWSNIKGLAFTNQPWLIGGDFNIIVNSNEKVGGAPPDTNAMNDFGNCIMDSGLIDIGFEGLPFTWQWRNVKQRLDRILVNNAWLEGFKDRKSVCRERVSFIV